MIPAGELYEKLNDRIDLSLRCDWDNDGCMCCPDPSRPISRVLLALDVTDGAVDAALEGRYDLILTHHPLIFTPIRALSPENAVSARLIRLIRGGISVFSFHTRLDAMPGGVNDALAGRIGIRNPVPFGPDGEKIGRIGQISPMPFADFADFVKSALSAPFLQTADPGRPVRRVALVGGAGKDYLPEAVAAGADVYLTGEMGHHAMLDAADAGIGLILAGHFCTELPVLDKLREMAAQADPALEFGLYDKNPVGFL